MGWPLRRPDVELLAVEQPGREVDRMAGVMPQQVIGPAARLTEHVEVGATHEIRLDHQMLQVKAAGAYPLAQEPVRSGEAARVRDHDRCAGSTLRSGHPLGTLQG